MNTVRQWSRRKGYTYLFYGDELVDVVPSWYRDKVNNQIHLVSDLARLIIAKMLLEEGYDHVIWIDTDVLVFAPDQFQLPLHHGYAFSKEVYVANDGRGQLRAYHRVNNAVMAMSQGNEFLSFYIDACQKMIKTQSVFRRTTVGTEFLTALNQHFTIDSITNVALFSPLVIRDLALGEGAALSLFCEHWDKPLSAVNLCLTFRGKRVDGVDLTDSLFDTVIARLLDTQGECINSLILPTGHSVG